MTWKNSFAKKPDHWSKVGSNKSLNHVISDSPETGWRNQNYLGKTGFNRYKHPTKVFKRGINIVNRFDKPRCFWRKGTEILLE